MSNDYVDFVSDSDFLRCVEHVCYAYPNAKTTTDLFLQRNGIDPFKIVFDIMKNNMDLEQWREFENSRQADKTVNNTIGEFHQKLLGCVDGWIDLETGDPTKLDLKKKDDTIYMEIKNKYNTVNDNSLSKVWEHLNDNLKEYPDSLQYWAYIVSKNGSSGEGKFKNKNREKPQIKKIWGKAVYELVTGDPEALESVWRVLPNAINDVLQTDRDLPDLRRIEKDWFKRAF